MNFADMAGPRGMAVCSAQATDGVRWRRSCGGAERSEPLGPPPHDPNALGVEQTSFERELGGVGEHGGRDIRQPSSVALVVSAAFGQRVEGELDRDRPTFIVVRVRPWRADAGAEQGSDTVKGVGGRSELPIDQRTQPALEIHGVRVTDVSMCPAHPGYGKGALGSGPGRGDEVGRGAVQIGQKCGHLSEPSGVEAIVLDPDGWIRTSAGHEREDLSIVLIDAEESRRRLEADSLQVEKQGLDDWRPRRAGTSHGVADPHHPTRVHPTARQDRFLGLVHGVVLDPPTVLGSRPPVSPRRLRRTVSSLRR